MKVTKAEQLIADSWISFVNMDHRTDRLDRMVTELHRVGLPVNRTRGQRPEEYKGDPYKVRTMQRRTAGAIGCHMSQTSIMIDALRKGKHAWVMEDDIQFCSDLPERLETIHGFLSENDWDVFWLGSAFHLNPPFWHWNGKSKMDPDCSAHLGYDAKLTSNLRIIRTFGAFDTFAYIVNIKSIAKVLTLLDEHLHTSIGIDWLFIKLQPQLRTFAYLPGCVKQIDNKSDIGQGDTIWSGMLKLNGTFENSAYVWQDLQTQFDPSTFNFAEAR